MTEQERQRTIEHECAHGAMALTVGVDVDRIEVFERKRGPHLGFANFLLGEMDAEMARRTAMAILAGPALDDGWEIPSWPLDENGSGDEKLLAAFTKRAGIDSARAYDSLVAAMWKVSASERFDRIFTTLCLFMERMLVADQRVIDEAKRIAWQDLDEDEEPEPRPEVDVIGPVYEEASRFPTLMAPGKGLTWRYVTTDTDTDDYPKLEPYKPFLQPAGSGSMNGKGRVGARFARCEIPSVDHSHTRMKFHGDGYG